MDPDIKYNVKIKHQWVVKQKPNPSPLPPWVKKELKTIRKYFLSLQSPKCKDSKVPYKSTAHFLGLTMAVLRHHAISTWRKHQHNLLRGLDGSRCWRLWSPGCNGIYARFFFCARGLKRTINLWLSLPVCNMCSAYHLYILWCMVITMVKKMYNTCPLQLGLKRGHLSYFSLHSWFYHIWQMINIGIYYSEILLYQSFICQEIEYFPSLSLPRILYWTLKFPALGFIWVNKTGKLLFVQFS